MNPSSKHFTIHTMTDGIYAAVAKPGGGAMANVGFVDLGDAILVFDSFNTQQAAAELRDAIAIHTELEDVAIPEKYEDWSAPEVYRTNIEYLLTQIQ